MATKTKVIATILAIILVSIITISSTSTNVIPKESIVEQQSLIQLYSTNTRVQQWKHYFACVQTKSLESKRSRDFYQPAVLRLFIDNGIPKDRAEIYAEIPDVESLWRPNAISHRGAMGMWQIMPATASRYKFNPRDMYDPVKATNCAVKYLYDLDTLYKGDVAAVLFSYNGGEGGVAKQAKNFKTNNYWLIDFTSRETYDFAPKVLGAWLYNNQHN